MQVNSNEQCSGIQGNTISCTTAKRLDRLVKIDLRDIRRKLMEPLPEGQNWTEDKTILVEKWYRRFLSLYIKYPDKKIVPNLEIDTFWHQHILDTRAYAVDCESFYGTFLHHYPYFGMNGDEIEFEIACDDTYAVCLTEFNEDYSMVPGFEGYGMKCGGKNCKDCGRCKTCKGT